MGSEDPPEKKRNAGSKLHILGDNFQNGSMFKDKRTVFNMVKCYI